MDWKLLVEVAVPFITSLATCSYLAGGQKEIQRRVSEQIADHENRLNNHDKELESHNLKIERLRWWREGFDSGISKKIDES